MANKFIQYFEDSFKDNWDLPAMTNYETNQTFKYSDVAREIEKLHILFRVLGVSPGDKISLIGPNTSEWMIVFMATISFGAVIVPILPNSSKEDLNNIINHSESKVLFISDFLWDMVDIPTCPNVQAAFSLFDYHGMYCVKEVSIIDLMDDVYTTYLRMYPRGIKKENVKYQGQDENLIVLNYTSGTTDQGKAVMLCGNNFLDQIGFTEKYKTLGEKGSVFLSYIPLAHVGGYVGIFTNLIFGSHTVFLSKFPSPIEMFDVLGKIKPNILVMVPLYLDVLYNSKIESLLLDKYHAKDVTKLDKKERESLKSDVIDLMGGRITRIMIGGASLNPVVDKLFSIIEMPYSVTYAMTETASLITANMNRKIGSVGKAVEGVCFEIDSDDPFTIPGEIYVKGNNVMMGYYKNEYATKDIFTKDGWLRTGDMGIIDEEKNLFIKGRCKTMILTSSGQNVYPEVIEEKINQSEYITESVVVQDKDRIVSWIYPNQGKVAELDSSELTLLLEEERKRINVQLASYEYISEFIIHSTPFERTAKRSIKRYLYEIKK